MLRFLMTTSMLMTLHVCMCQLVPFRTYTKGEKFEYMITTESLRNGKSSGKHVAISTHAVDIDSSGAFAENITWRSKAIQSADKNVILDSVAQKVSAYRVSLSAAGRVLLPKLDNPEMIGEITDLNTFYVAVSPALNVHKLSSKTSFLKNPEIREGNFADSIRILFGKDCLAVSQQLLEKSDSFVVVKTMFSPPGRACLKLMIPDSLNRADSVNFQMIQKGDKGKVNYFWGVETFEITTKLSRRTGKILDANMLNELQLTMLYNCSPDLKTFDAKLPMTIKRTIQLSLLNSSGSSSGLLE